ncbi:phosphatidate cytidylyltransferase [Shimia sp.]|uniref:phosphatidate cytidylyltransferase n=1 Tax=Shimia sp. TaxID=1954381 RepID=UPI00329698D1
MIGLNIHQLALTGAVLLAIGYGVLGLLVVIPTTRDTARDLVKTFFSATLIAAVLICATLSGTVGIVALMVVVALRVGFEAGHVRFGTAQAAWGMAILCLGLSLAVMSETLIAVALAGVWPLLLVRVVKMQKGRTAHALLELLVFPVIPMALMAHGGVAPEMRVAVAGTYVLVEIFDSFALLFGKLFGKRPAFPILSPRKTVEGLMGGAISLCVLTAISAGLLGLNVGAMVGVALMVAMLAVAGDLAASRLKRNAGVKDYPVVMKRQGGLLDSLDSWIAASAGLVALYFVLVLL